jgi:hypothetical protein
MEGKKICTTASSNYSSRDILLLDERGVLVFARIKGMLVMIGAEEFFSCEPCSNNAGETKAGGKEASVNKTREYVLRT